jgi:hypothetical protein
VVRGRNDKATPNHKTVFEKVWKSITDGISVDEVIRLAESGLAESAPKYGSTQPEVSSA